MTTEEDAIFGADGEIDPSKVPTANGVGARRGKRSTKKKRPGPGLRMVMPIASEPPMPNDTVPVAALPPPIPNTAEAGKTTTETGKGLFGDGSKPAILVWPAILEQERAKNIGPDAIQITVRRIPTGPVRAAVEDLAPISGDLVCGIEGSKGPGEDLWEYLVWNYHLPFNGPARYNLQFGYKLGAGRIPGGTAELTLGHPEQVRKQLEQQAEYQRMRVASGAAPARAPLRIPMPAHAPYPAAPVATPVAALGIAPEIHAALVEAARTDERYKGVLQELDKARAISPPTIAVPPMSRAEALRAVGISAEEAEEVHTKRLAKAVAMALAGMGITPAGIGATPAAPVAPVVPPTQKGLVEQIRDLFSTMAEIKKVGEQMGTAIAGATGTETPADQSGATMKGIGIPWPGSKTEEEPEGMPIRLEAKNEEESWPQYLIRIGMNNPTAAQKIMSRAAEVLDPETLMKFANRFAALGSQQARAAAAVAPKQMTPAGPVQTGWEPIVPPGG